MVPNNQYEKVIQINFISTYTNLLQHFICITFLLIEDYEKCALQKEPVIAPFVGRFKTATLRKSSLSFIRTYRSLLKNFIFTKFFLLEDFEQGALRKKLIITTFVEQFKTATLRKS